MKNEKRIDELMNVIPHCKTRAEAEAIQEEINELEGGEEEKIIYFKDEGEFLSTKLFEGKPLTGTGFVPYGTLEERTFKNKKACRQFAKSIGYTPEFDY